MDTQAVKQTIHELVDQIEDGELLDLYLKLLKRELRKDIPRQDFFATANEKMTTRAKASLEEIAKGNTRSIRDFKDDIKTWKKNRAL
jgi:hypothetical protein